MKKHRKSSLSGAIRAYAAEERAFLPSTHVASAELDAFSRDELVGEERHQIARRIPLEPELTVDLIERNTAAIVEHREGDWQALLARAEEEGVKTDADAELGQTSGEGMRLLRRTEPARSKPLMIGLAAGWLLTAIGFALVLTRIDPGEGDNSLQLASNAPPIETHVVTATLRPDELLRSADSALPTFRINRRTERITLFLLSVNFEEFDTYSVTLLDQEDSLLGSRDDLVAAADQSFTVSLDPNLLRSGIHRLLVSGHIDDATQEVSSYCFLVEEADRE
ncbi:MAG: hypothetical protein MPN21_18735 [Thermoanaerobaculia bacterium]|nr:hypothetical protein [Thermoanaerobaculia bacterium]